MFSSLLVAAALSAPAALQDPPPTSRPTSRPTRSAPSDRERAVPADFGADAPGREVMNRKFLPMRGAPYADADAVRDRVRDQDLVIGLVVEGQAFAYPINMLGGPQREIVNEEFAGVPFCVNW